MATPSTASVVRLTFGAFSVDLFRFPSDNSYSRQFVVVGDTEYTIAGNPTDNGAAYEHKHIWELESYVDASEYRKLHFLFQSADTARRSFGDYRVLVEDYVQPFEEISPRTRGLATGASEVSVDGGLEYSASYYARIFPPTSERKKSGQYPYKINVTLRELDKTTP